MNDKCGSSILCNLGTADQLLQALTCHMRNTHIQDTAFNPDRDYAVGMVPCS